MLQTLMLFQAMAISAGEGGNDDKAETSVFFIDCASVSSPDGYSSNEG
jgi:hypothetical protein